MGDALDDIRAQQRQKWEANQMEQKRKAQEQALFEMDRMPEPQQTVTAKPTPPAPASAEETAKPKKENKASKNFDAATSASASSTAIVASRSPKKENKASKNFDAATSASASSTAIVAAGTSQTGVPAPTSRQATQAQVPQAAPPTGGSAASSSNAPWNPSTSAAASSSTPWNEGQAQHDELPVVMEGAAINLPLCGCGAPGEGGPTEQLFALAGLNAPSQDSFEYFFHEWFVHEHFPGMSEALQKELVHRAKSKGFFSGLASQVKKWAMANTDVRLQADVWCSYFVQNTPPVFRSFGCVRMAIVNLGSQAAPCAVTFLGLPDKPDHWILAPWASTEVDCSALLDELDGRGGMAALLAAAA